MCFLLVLELGKKLPVGVCLVNRAGSSHFPCPDAESREAGRDFSVCSTNLDQGSVVYHASFPPGPHLADL